MFTNQLIYKRVALYVRISTTDRENKSGKKKQNPQTQLKPLKEFAKAREWLIQDTYIDKISSSKEARPELKRLMDDAGKRKFDVVLVFRFDRFVRSSK